MEAGGRRGVGPGRSGRCDGCGDGVGPFPGDCRGDPVPGSWRAGAGGGVVTADSDVSVGVGVVMEGNVDRVEGLTGRGAVPGTRSAAGVAPGSPGLAGASPLNRPPSEMARCIPVAPTTARRSPEAEAPGPEEGEPGSEDDGPVGGEASPDGVLPVMRGSSRSAAGGCPPRGCSGGSGR
jgi:hypothetical protein